MSDENMTDQNKTQTDEAQADQAQTETTTEELTPEQQLAEAERALKRIDNLFIRLDDANDNEAESALRIIRRLMPKAGISFKHIRDSIGSGQLNQEMLDQAVADAVAEYALVNDQLKQSETLLLEEIEKLNLMLAYYGQNNLQDVKINTDDLKARLAQLTPRLKDAVDHLAQYQLPKPQDLEAELKNHVADVVLKHNTYNDTSAYLGIFGQSYLWALRRLCGYNIDPKHIDNLKKTAETIDAELKRVEETLGTKLDVVATQTASLIDILTPLSSLTLGTQNDFNVAMRSLMKAEEKIKKLSALQAENNELRYHNNRLEQLLDEEKIKTKALLNKIEKLGIFKPAVLDTIRKKLKAKGYLTFSEQERQEYTDAMRDFESAVEKELAKRKTAEELKIAELEKRLAVQEEIITTLSLQTATVLSPNDLSAINTLAQTTSNQVFIAEQLTVTLASLKEELAQKATMPWYKKLLGVFRKQSEAEILTDQLQTLADKLERAQKEMRQTNTQNKNIHDGFNREAQKALGTLDAQVKKLEKLAKRERKA